MSKKIILELFKGSGSITNYYKDDPNVEVISLDFDPKYKPDICCDIMNWDYKTYPVNHFDIIWASPECNIYSTLQYTHIGRKWKDKEHLIDEQKKHIKFMLKTIEIIEYFNPDFYYIENPDKSMIWNYIIDNDISKKYVRVDYCKFGFNYRKRTKILTNKILDNVLCDKPKHDIKIGFQKKGQADYPKSLLERYSIPQKLLRYLLT